MLTKIGVLAKGLHMAKKAATAVTNNPANVVGSIF
jgi:hypothetical protein